MTGTYEQLPADLPVPVDDGATAHVTGMAVPPISLPATRGGSGGVIALQDLAAGRAVLYIYPMTGQPGVALPEGWDQIPGARGCTPESIGFREHSAELSALGVLVAGLSSQDPAYQLELAQRLELTYPVLSDPAFELAAALELPTFTAAGVRLYKRVTLVLRAGVVEHVFYPIFPTDTHAGEVTDWVWAHPTSAASEASNEPDNRKLHTRKLADGKLDTVSWTWRLEAEDGTPITEPAVPPQPTQSDAETWLGENWRELAAAGIKQASLFEDGVLSYGPMSLSES